MRKCVTKIWILRVCFRKSHFRFARTMWKLTARYPAGSQRCGFHTSGISYRCRCGRPTQYRAGPTLVLVGPLLDPLLFGASQIAEMIMVMIGRRLRFGSVLMFGFIGKGTPAPFDPPRKLVICGPYSFVRNPMYIGAGMTPGWCDPSSLRFGVTSK